MFFFRFTVWSLKKCLDEFQKSSKFLTSLGSVLTSHFLIVFGDEAWGKKVVIFSDNSLEGPKPGSSLGVGFFCFPFKIFFPGSWASFGKLFDFPYLCKLESWPDWVGVDVEYLWKIFCFIAYSICIHNNNLFWNVMIYLRSN